MRRLMGVLLAATAALSSTGARCADDAALAALGKRIYREGVLPSGAPLAATLAGGARVEGQAAACATCHRKSGLGSSEGGNIIHPLTVPGFFDGQENRRRYARDHGVQLRELRYTDAAFDRALREGRSADGRALSPLMPRYTLGEHERAGLRAYLTAVAQQPSPGVSDDEIHVATIVTPDADTRVRDATLHVLRKLVDARNAGTRSERGRRRAGVESMHVDWRRLTLHVWTLEGDAADWGRQLEQRYREQPVFAVLSGAGRRWEPVHDFCERQELPCLFPNVDLPGRSEPGEYSLYLNRGTRLDGEVMAAHLGDQGWSGPVWQVLFDDPRATAGAAAFDAAWQAQGHAAAAQVVLHEGAALQEALAALPRDAAAAVLVWWPGAGADAHAWSRLTGHLPPDGPVLLSGTLLGEGRPDVPPALSERLRVAWPFAIPSGGRARLGDRSGPWLSVHGLPGADPRVQANTFLAFTLVSDAIVHIGNNYSREYLIERIEHGVDKSLTRGAFAEIGLGPGQRFVSKGAYITRMQDRRLHADGDWIVP